MCPGREVVRTERAKLQIPGELTEATQRQLDCRIRNLDKLIDSVWFALNQASFPGQPHALDLATDLRVKAKATENMFRVGTQLREPARTRVLSRVLSAVCELERAIASRFGLELT